MVAANAEIAWLRRPSGKLRARCCPVAHCPVVGYGPSRERAVEAVWYHYVAFHLGRDPEPLWHDRERIRPELYEQLAAELAGKDR